MKRIVFRWGYVYWSCSAAAWPMLEHAAARGHVFDLRALGCVQVKHRPRAGVRALVRRPAKII